MEGNTCPNKTMRPFVKGEQLCAIPIVLSILDTKGGVNVEAGTCRALLEDGSTLDGLYAAGNCAASFSGEGYFQAGATIGIAMVQGYIAGGYVASSRLLEW